MPITRLIPLLAALLAALGRVEASAAPPRCCDDRPSVSSQDPTPLDDDMEAPDREEDDEPDDPGVALVEHQRSLGFAATFAAPIPSAVASADGSLLIAAGTNGAGRWRFLRLCRLQC